MSVYRSDDPGADFDRWEAERARLMEELPVCDYCYETIEDDHWYDINGDNICQECLDRNFRKEVCL